MARQAVFPPALAHAVAASGFSPAIRAGDLIFLTGATGADAQGVMPDDAATQTRNALQKVLTILDAAGAQPQDVVEITSYHIGLRDHFDTVDALLRETLGLPLPAWTAVEVAGLRREGAVIEMRIVVHAPLPQT
ncbi:Rid family hydrolase [uncultured Sulfitobacter sp.]|uniref:Rid family hydrolase n=1 Tax=uncultured Sulfitobacter sp. TaxID=191468 RepID=UPI00262D43CF|nr:Rid family hydrolase [uncultured Sulfitobacter sp.]